MARWRVTVPLVTLGLALVAWLVWGGQTRPAPAGGGRSDAGTQLDPEGPGEAAKSAGGDVQRSRVVDGDGPSHTGPPPTRDTGPDDPAYRIVLLDGPGGAPVRDTPVHLGDYIAAEAMARSHGQTTADLVQLGCDHLPAIRTDADGIASVQRPRLGYVLAVARVGGEEALRVIHPQVWDAADGAPIPLILRPRTELTVHCVGPDGRPRR